MNFKDKIINRILEMKETPGLNTSLLFADYYKKNPLYLGDEHWKELNEEDLFKFFELVCAFSYKSR